MILVALGSALWGTDTVLRRPLANSLSASSIVLYEHLILCVVALPALFLARKELLRLKLSHWLAILGIGWGGSALATVLFTEAIHRGNPTTAVLLQKFQPLFTVALAAWLLGERVARRYWAYLAVALAGAWMVSFGDRGLLPSTFKEIPRIEASAALLALAAAALWGMCTVLGRLISPHASFLTITSLRFVVAIPLLLAISRISGVPLAWPNEKQLVTLSAMAFIPGLAALLLYYRGLHGTPAPVAALAELCFPTTSVILNWIFLHQTITFVQGLGFLAIWGVVWQIQRTGAAPLSDPLL